VKTWHCTIKVDDGDGTQQHEISVEANTKTAAHEVAFAHYMELADEAVMKTPESPRPLVLIGIDLAQGKDTTAYAAVCGNCGNPHLQRSGTCYICPSCGTTTGCS
jgi:predicted RNA-binding Zn-ribbon protein involved in translation (DUF1610 family)